MLVPVLTASQFVHCFNMSHTSSFSAVKRRVLTATTVLALSSTTMVAAAEELYPACTREPSEGDVAAAKGAHKLAEQFYAKGKYDRAIGSWTDAYSFDCRAHRLLINIGNGYEKIGQTGKAIKAFETYIERMGDKAERTIVDKVANLQQMIRTAPAPAPPPPPPPSGDNDADGGAGAAPWVLVGTGGAAAIAGAVLLGVGAGKFSDAKELCPTRNAEGKLVCPDDDQVSTDLGNTGTVMMNAGGVVLGIGLAAAAAGVLWYVVGGDDDSTDAPPTTTTVRVQPWLGTTTGGLGFWGLGLSGSF